MAPSKVQWSSRFPFTVLVFTQQALHLQYPCCIVRVCVCVGCSTEDIEQLVEQVKMLAVDTSS